MRLQPDIESDIFNRSTPSNTEPSRAGLERPSYPA